MRQRKKRFIQGITFLIIYIKKLLDSDWLGAVQLKRNTSAKSVTLAQKLYHQCKWHIVILDCDWLKDNRKYSKTMISRKMITKILCRKFGKRFLELKKIASGRSSGASCTRIFQVYNIQEVITRPFSFNLESICTCELFKKLKLHSPKWLVQFLLFEIFTGANLFQIEQETIWLLILFTPVMEYGGCQFIATVHLRLVPPFHWST